MTNQKAKASGGMLHLEDIVVKFTPFTQSKVPSERKSYFSSALNLNLRLMSPKYILKICKVMFDNLT